MAKRTRTATANGASSHVKQRRVDKKESAVADSLGAKRDELLAKLNDSYSFIHTLLQEFADELQRDPREASHVQIENDVQWFWATELRFYVTFLYDLAFHEFSSTSTRPDQVVMKDSKEHSHQLYHRKDLQERLTFLSDLKVYLQSLANFRLNQCDMDGQDVNNLLPRVFRLAEDYRLTDQETELLQLLVVYQGCQSNAVRCQMIEEDASRRLASFQRIAGISDVDFEEFYDDQREIVKEGILLFDDEQYNVQLSLSNIAVRVLLGRSLTSHQMLKLSQTALEDLLRDEGVYVEEEAKPVAKANGKKMTVETLQSHTPVPVVEAPAQAQAQAQAPETTDKEKDKDEIKSYDPANQLEYLEDRFHVVAFAIRASGARVKDQMKEAGTKQPWETTTATAGKRELKAKERVHDKKTRRRLALTRQEDKPLPRLEELTEKFDLSTFEQNVIVMLIGKTISPVIKNLLDGVDTSPVQRMDDSIVINQILSVFCDTFQEQVAHRKFFYKSGKLLSKGLVKVHRSRWHAGGDLVDQRVDLDRRVLDWVVGLDTEMNELVEGSDLYHPKVQMDQVVLPEEHKKTILETVESYEAFREYRKKQDLEDTVGCGKGLVLLLCGASGTGKTMTVNAVANHLDKRVLLVDFPSLQGKQRDGEADADLRALFREADMHNAVLFFDECETIFKQRDVGGDRLLNSLLTEIEKYPGLVFLATNRPFDLDEAMHRRITAVFEFKAPDHLQRRKIWEVLLDDNLPTDDDIDWDEISLKYELSGGFIQNAITSALLKAISRDKTSPKISQQDIVHGCALQMRGSLHMKTFDHRVVPTSGLDALLVSKDVKTQLQDIANFEKARGVVYNQWGFTLDGDSSKQKGTSVLFVGPAGVGKMRAAKALGFEVGRPLKVVNVNQLQGDSMNDVRSALESVFNDARLMDAVLVLEGMESFGSQLDEEVRAKEMMKIVKRMDTFPSVTIIVAELDKVQSSGLRNSDMGKKVKFFLEFSLPKSDLRQEIWKACLPAKAPVEDKLDVKKLADRYELNYTAIGDAVYRAAAKAALRKEERWIKMQDLMQAAEEEKKRSRGSAGAMDSLFV